MTFHIVSLSSKIPHGKYHVTKLSSHSPPCFIQKLILPSMAYGVYDIHIRTQHKGHWCWCGRGGIETLCITSRDISLHSLWERWKVFERTKHRILIWYINATSGHRYNITKIRVSKYNLHCLIHISQEKKNMDRRMNKCYTCMQISHCKNKILTETSQLGLVSVLPLNYIPSQHHNLDEPWIIVENGYGQI